MRIIMLTAVVIFSSLSIANGQLVGYWNFDDNVADQSGNGNDGTIVGPAAYVADTPALIPGKSLSFNADSYVNVTQNSGLPIAPEPAFTISMWVKGDGTAQDDDRVFSEGSSANNNALFNLGTKQGGDTGQFDFYYRTDTGASPNHLFSNGTPFDGTWHHIAWVDQEGLATLYIDGAADTDFDYTAFRTDLNSDTTTIGGILRAAECCLYTGNIDDVAIWSQALSGGEVALLAEGVPPPQVPEPSSIVMISLGMLGLLGLRRR
jgi:hypothetical protein